MNPIDATGAAKMLGRSRAWFYAHLEELAERGFPDALPVCGRWDPVAIEAWKTRSARMYGAVRAHRDDCDIDRLFGL